MLRKKPLSPAAEWKKACEIIKGTGEGKSARKVFGELKKLEPLVPYNRLRLAKKLLGMARRSPKRGSASDSKIDKAHLVGVKNLELVRLILENARASGQAHPLLDRELTQVLFCLEPPQVAEAHGRRAIRKWKHSANIAILASVMNCLGRKSEADELWARAEETAKRELKDKDSNKISPYIRSRSRKVKR
jgi:hypothetical protein